MSARPRPRGQSVLTGSMILIVGLAGLASVDVGISIAFTAFALCLIVAALECRSETGTVFTTATFDSKQMNRAILAEFVLAVLVTQMDVFHRMLGTTDIALAQFGGRSCPRSPCCCGRSGSSSPGERAPPAAQMRVDLVPATTWSTAEPSPPRQLDADTAARLLSSRAPPRDRATHPCAGWPPNSSPRSAT